MNTMTQWTVLPFAGLGAELLYQVMKIRQKVFVVEQQCPYLDADGQDFKALHVLGREGEALVAYARLFGPSPNAPFAAVGRVLVAQTYRGQKLAYRLMEVCHGEIRDRWGNIPVRLSAQQYLMGFYKKLGYEPIGNGYLEDNIPHWGMERVWV